MPTITIDARRIHLRLSLAERIFALRGHLTLPLDTIEAVDVVPDALAAVQGLRAPGLGVPGGAKIGTWRRRRGTTIALVRGRGPGLRIRTTDRATQVVVVSTPQAADLAAQLAPLVEGSAR